jgi:cytochrome c biogenesis protein CcdA/glutaredoxin
VRVLLMPLVAVLLGVSGALTAPALGAEPAPDDVELVLFWGDGCPHCEAERAWLAEARDDYPALRVTEHEVWYDEQSRALFAETAADLGFEPSGVPTTVIGEQYWVGWSPTVRSEIENLLENADAAGTPSATKGDSSTVDVPLVGDVAVGADSLVLSTLVIGFVDGVNPCSLWVVSVLLAIVVRTGSRRRVLAIGTTFLAVTAGMYALYMAGIYSAMGVVGHLGAVQALVAVVAAVFGVVSIKDYFAFKKGISFTIPESSKPGLYRRMRTVAGEDRLWPALGATAVLAVGVSLLETPCTAGFPVLWTGLLADSGVGTAEAAMLFVLYMIPFLVDELLVFGVAVLTMRAMKMQERHGRLLKLVAGTMLLTLAGVVLVRPETMSEPRAALAVFAASFGVAAVVHLVTTRGAQRRQGGGRPSDHQPTRPVDHGSTR